MNLTFFETVFNAEAIILTLYFALISIVQGLSKSVFVTRRLKFMATFAGWYLLGATVLTLSIIYVQDYFPDGFSLGTSYFSLSWMYGSGSALIIMILLVIGFILMVRLVLKLIRKIPS